MAKRFRFQLRFRYFFGQLLYHLAPLHTVGGGNRLENHMTLTPLEFSSATWLNYLKRNCLLEQNTSLFTQRLHVARYTDAVAIFFDP